ncbi:MAG: two component transcriptional regulator, winged helix family [Verrucomicrobiales bacterium]|nr:two component transcriptional regulator, winged helix family [Verrucomicrobiales bacterium]
MNAGYIEYPTPVCKDLAPPQEQLTERFENGRTLDILYVEDDADILRFATIVLTKRGFKVTPASNGLQGWRALHSHPFDLIITDNEMPVMTGLEMIEKIRAAGIGIPIILASASASRLDSPENEGLGLAACIQKPFTFDELLAAVNHVSDSTPRSHQPQVSQEIARHLLETVPHQDWGLNE